MSVFDDDIVDGPTITTHFPLAIFLWYQQNVEDG